MTSCDKTCDSPCEDCEDCSCGEEEKAESDTPNLDLLRQLQQQAPVDDTQRISIDRDNADLYAFSDIDLRTMREGKEVTTSPLEWSHEEITQIAHRVVGNKLDV